LLSSARPLAVKHGNIGSPIARLYKANSQDLKIHHSSLPKCKAAASCSPLWLALVSSWFLVRQFFLSNIELYHLLNLLGSLIRNYCKKTTNIWIIIFFSGNAKAENEQIQFLLPPINPGEAPQPMSAVDESNEEDKKLLLPFLALKPLVIASGLLAGNKLQKKKPSTPRPNNSVPPAENTVLVSIGDETDDQKEDTLEEEARKLLLPLLTLKPLLFASILAGSKLPASSIPKPGIGFTITKHESATTSPPVTTTPASTTTTTTQKPTSNTTTTPPIDNSNSKLII
jgi:hypothetical protein